MSDLKENILHFWFVETKPEQWFQGGPDFDALINKKFSHAYEQAANGEYDHWRADAGGCLALCVLLDQFPRNLFRGQPRAFATDDKALQISRHALDKNFDMDLPIVKRNFLYLPFMHSENMQDQKRSLELYAPTKDEDPNTYKHAQRHYEEIERFGRFPYRNKALCRATTDEEEEYLRNLNF